MRRLPFWPAGTIPPGEGLYLPRPADEAYLNHLLAGHDCHIMGSRQSGKSSLANHAIGGLLDEGRRVAFVDLNLVAHDDDTPAAAWVSQIVCDIARPLGYLPRLEELGLADVASLPLAEALRRLVAASEGDLVLIFDEFDSLERFPLFAHTILACLRGVQEARAREVVFRRLVISLCGVRTPAQLFADLPGERGAKEIHGELLWLDDFPLDDATYRQFSESLDPAVGESYECARDILRYCGGFPQAASWLGRLVNRNVGTNGGWRWSTDFAHQLPERLLPVLGRAAATDGAGPTASERLDTDFFKVVEGYLYEGTNAALSSLQVYTRILSKSQPYDDRQHSHRLLLWSGLCRVDNQNNLRVRCDLFRLYFDLPWVANAENHVLSIEGPPPRSSVRKVPDKRLCILSTGGTIGMVEQRGGKVKTPDDPHQLDHLFQAVRRLAEVEVVNLLSLDSAEIGPDEWVAIAQAIKKREDLFDGFIVAHGTDTMPYTASAVAFALGPNLSFPVVFTGSQTTIDIEHGDAIVNLLRAGLVAAEDLHEVVICFGDHVFRACRTQKKDDRGFDAFESPGYPPLGHVAEDVQIVRANLRPRPASGGPGSRSSIDLRASFSAGILQIAQTPGSFAAFYQAALAARDVNREPLCKGVVIQSLGAGNVPSLDPRFALTGVISAAQKQGIPVVLTSQYPVHAANLTRYSPAQAAIGAGAIPTGNMTIAAVVTKFSWVLAQVEEQVRLGQVSRDPNVRIEKVRQMMQIEYVGEGGLVVIGPPAYGASAPVKGPEQA